VQTDRQTGGENNDMALAYNSIYTGWPNKNCTFLRYQIFVATTDKITRFFAELFRNYSRKQQATIFLNEC